jgi:hypothetical protein
MRVLGKWGEATVGQIDTLEWHVMLRVSIHDFKSIGIASSEGHPLCRGQA